MADVQPRRRLDHILGTSQVAIGKREALPHLLSDHLGLAAEVTIQ